MRVRFLQVGVGANVWGPTHDWTHPFSMKPLAEQTPDPTMRAGGNNPNHDRVTRARPGSLALHRARGNRWHGSPIRNGRWLACWQRAEIGLAELLLAPNPPGKRNVFCCQRPDAMVD